MNLRHFVMASLSLAACGGGAKHANAPASASLAPSHISIEPDKDMNDPGYDVTGPAFAQYSPGMQVLMIYVFDPAMKPAPDCSVVGASGLQKFQSGGFASVGTMGYAGGAKTGTFPVQQGGYIKGDVSKHELRMAGGVTEGSTLTITSYDKQTLEAEAKNGSGKTIASLHATVCPDDATPPRHMPTQEEIQARMAAQEANPELGIGPGESVLVIKPSGADRTVTQGDGALAKLDPKTKMLNIYVWDFAYQPPPTCDHLAIEPEQMGSGSLAVAVIPNFPARAKGKFPVGGAQSYDFMNGPNGVVTAGSVADASTIEIRQYDDNGFLAHLTTDPNSKVAVSGLIQARTCPDGPIDLDSKKSKPAKTSKKKKKK